MAGTMRGRFGNGETLRRTASQAAESHEKVKVSQVRARLLGASLGFSDCRAKGETPSGPSAGCRRYTVLFLVVSCYFFSFSLSLSLSFSLMPALRACS
jgi:hypothetical protein